MYDAYKNLAEAIVATAFKDYKDLKMFLRRHPKNRTACKELRRLKEFLFSDRFRAITNIDPNYMVKKIDEFVEGDGKICISVGIS